MKRASYRDAVDWIAQNDSPGDDDSMDPEAVARLLSTILIAAIFDAPSERVARDVVRRRKAVSR